MDSQQIIARLKREEWVLQRVRGSHHMFYKPGHGVLVVPHPRKDLPTGLLDAIKRKADWK